MALYMKYFVLKPEGNGPHAFAARQAMMKYAHEIRQYDRELAQSLEEWARRERDASIIKKEHVTD